MVTFGLVVIAMGLAFVGGWGLGASVHGDRTARLERVAIRDGLRARGHKRAALAVEIGEV